MFCFVFLFFSKIKVPFETFISAELLENCFSYLDQRGDGTWAHLAGVGPRESEITCEC